MTHRSRSLLLAPINHVYLFTIAILTGALFSHAATPVEWSSRAIYQIVTDRFNIGNGVTTPCSDWSTYCGGTFNGIIEQLGYIQDLGFDAIWISPVVTNQPDAYHGYAASDLYSINPYFGGEDGLLALSQALHDRGMWLMVDVVANHMGPPPQRNNYTNVQPFNDISYYHSCGGCPQVPGQECWIRNWSNHTEMQLCQLDGLPDLNQTNSFVHDTLVSWVSDLIETFSIDGLRIDTVPEVSIHFWKDFQVAANIYAVGEVFNSNISWVASYQGPQGLTATLSYPLYFVINNVFANGGSCSQLSETLQEYDQYFADMSVLGTFAENHDNPRFLNASGTTTQSYQSALLFTMYTVGIPISYYGAEALLTGGHDPDNREPLWTYDFDTIPTTPMYQWIQSIMLFRKEKELWSFDQLELVVDDSVYFFSRDTVLVALTNSEDDQTRTISGDQSPYKPNETICNLFTDECLVTDSDGSFSLTLQAGEQKVFDYQQTIHQSQQRLKRKRELKQRTDQIASN